jgi:hypothetical protein
MHTFSLILLTAAVIIANGFGRRFAGGLLSHWVGDIGGTLVARLVQGAIVGGSVLALIRLTPYGAGPAWWAAAAVALSFAGAAWGFPSLVPRWPFVDFNRSNMVPAGPLDTLALSLNGAIACAPLALGAWAVGLSPWWMLAAGLARGPAYWIAAAYTPAWRWMEFEEWLPDQKRWILQPTALAEFYSGMALGAGLIRTL